MANTGNSIKWEAIRELAGSSLTTSYQVLGGVFTRDSFRVWLTNNSSQDIYISTDGVTNMLRLPALSGRAYDNKTNDMYVRAGTQFYVKAAAAGTGWVGLEVEYV